VPNILTFIHALIQTYIHALYTDMYIHTNYIYNSAYKYICIYSGLCNDKRQKHRREAHERNELLWGGYNY